MATGFKDRTLSLGLPGYYRTPDGVEFANLVVQKGGETARIRFSRGPNISLDLPLSAENLAVLARLLAPFAQIPAQSMPAALEHLRQTGEVLDSATPVQAKCQECGRVGDYRSDEIRNLAEVPRP